MNLDDEARRSTLFDYHISRETADKLDFFASELARWQAIKNLVSERDAKVLWSRHIADSLQACQHVQEGALADLGSGAGFPGLVIAISQPAMAVHLIDSDHRKSAFLRHIARQIAPNANIHSDRAETVLPRLSLEVATVTARALAPLSQLLAWAEPLLTRGAVGLFFKGRNYAAELTLALESWRFDYDLIPSRTDPAARIIRVHRLGEPISHDGPNASSDAKC